jgi:hypothetical protein
VENKGVLCNECDNQLNLVDNGRFMCERQKIVELSEEDQPTNLPRWHILDLVIILPHAPFFHDRLCVRNSNFEIADIPVVPLIRRRFEAFASTPRDTDMLPRRTREMKQLSMRFECIWSVHIVL